MESISGRSQLLGSLLKRVGNFNVDTFPRRLTFQKTVYFLQVFGFYLGYRFSWYLYGPYSPALTKDGFELRGFIDKMSEAGFPETEPEQKFQEFLRFIQPFKDN